MLKQQWRTLRAELAGDQRLAPALAEAKALAQRTLSWLLLNELVLVAQIYPIKAFIDTLGAKPFDRPRALEIVAIMVGLYLLSSALRWRMDTRRGRFYWRMWSLLWGFGHRVEQRQSVEWHKRHSTGDKESLMTKNVAKIDTLIDEAIFEAIPTVLRVTLTSLGIALFIDWHFGLLAILTVVAFVIQAVVSNGRMTADRQQARREGRELERFGTELTTNWRTLKYFGAEARRCQENQRLLDRFYEAETLRFRRLINALVGQEMIVNLSRGLLWALAVWEFNPSPTAIGSTVLALSWMERIYSNGYRVANFQRRINESWEPAKELLGLIANVPDIRQPDRPEWPILAGNVEFRNVSFSYASAGRPAIVDFNLVAQPNQTIALVGASGCGKSTTVELLMRSYDPDHGQILIDGVPLERIDYDRYRAEVVSIVSQDVQLFDETIRDNIRFGRLDATDAEVEESARQAYAHTFISEFPQGYDTWVGEDGILLSGGQKQRIAIARALLRRPRILVLDEATSSLDAESQHQVKQAIDQLIADRRCTIFVIAHRLSTVREADVIVVLDNGSISDLGSHEELTRHNGFYRRMCELEGTVLDEQ